MSYGCCHLDCYSIFILFYFLWIIAFCNTAYNIFFFTVGFVVSRRLIGCCLNLIIFWNTHPNRNHDFVLPSNSERIWRNTSRVVADPCHRHASNSCSLQRMRPENVPVVAQNHFPFFWRRFSLTLLSDCVTCGRVQPVGAFVPKWTPFAGVFVRQNRHQNQIRLQVGSRSICVLLLFERFTQRDKL